MMTFLECITLVQAGKGDQIADPEARKMAEEAVAQVLAKDKVLTG